MTAGSFCRLTARVALIAIVAGCAGESVSAPTRSVAARESASNGRSGSAPDKVQKVAPLQREHPVHARAEFEIIGPKGGRIELREAGLTVIVPAGALSSTQKITVTPVEGANVAYEFQPHGLTFAVPLTLQQDLGRTHPDRGGRLNSNTVQLGYFTDPANMTSVTELSSVTPGGPDSNVTVKIWHFSGYIFAGGRSE